MEKFDVTFLGSGPGGYVGAIRAAQRGAKVAVIEKDRLGGVCLNRGCIPTKALIASAKALGAIDNAASFGVVLAGSASADPEAIWKRKDKISDNLVKGIQSLFKNRGVTLFQGFGKLIAKDRIAISNAEGAIEIESSYIVIATGSEPAALPGLMPDGKLILTSDDVLAKPYIPKKLLIVGAGPIGMELACIFSAFGAQVTVVELMPRALPNEDEDVSELIEREFKKQKIKILTSRKIEEIEKLEDGVRAELSGGEAIEADRVLIGIGRKFNTADIGLEEVGVKLNARGAIEVDSRMKTNVDKVFAIGDITGGMLLAHVASAGGIVAAHNITGDDMELDLSKVPACVFTHPEIASVGINTRQANERGIEIKTGTFPMRTLGMAQAIGEISGFVKLIADKNRKLLGAHIVGHGASILIHEAALAIKAGMSADDIAESIHAHPSMSEAVAEAAEDIFGASIHLPGVKK